MDTFPWINIGREGQVVFTTNLIECGIVDPAALRTKVGYDITHWFDGARWNPFKPPGGPMAPATLFHWEGKGSRSPEAFTELVHKMDMHSMVIRPPAWFYCTPPIYTTHRSGAVSIRVDGVFIR